MRDLPDIVQLLDLAEGADGALAARCRAIAERERAEGCVPYAALEADMAKLLKVTEAPDLVARLAQDIRRGRFDAPGPERLRLEVLLWRHAIQRLHENDPDFII